MNTENTFASPWVEAPLASLADHIVAEYHLPLRASLPRVETMARQVLESHGPQAASMLPELLQVFRHVRAELEEHMLKEEHILFPMIRNGQGFMADGPIMVMEAEHAAANEAIARLRQLTDGYRAPQAACQTWSALWRELEKFDSTMQEHIYLENEILFPRALQG